MAFMAVARERYITDAAANDFLDLFRLFLPNSNKTPSTYGKLKTIVNSHSKNSLIKEQNIICASCCNEICNCGKIDKSVLLIFNVQFQLEEILTRYGMIMDEYRNSMLAETDMIDIHQGEYYRDAERFCGRFETGVVADGCGRRALKFKVGCTSANSISFSLS
uniref:Uncharacterized protein n=1 Tax=Panagrolaimus davidi TaxID=227884 RepID=A0A914RAC5_9BILA